ncbi:MAG: hypothetical protein R2771_03380 [Saprospiraceae bacterium]
MKMIISDYSEKNINKIIPQKGSYEVAISKRMGEAHGKFQIG